MQNEFSGTPQVEDGFTRIANELLDAILRFPFSKREMNVVFAVIRKTYGFRKKMDDLSLSQLRNITRINDANLSRTIRDLVGMGVLLKQQGQYSQSIGLNKKYTEWNPLPKRQPPCQNSKVSLAEIASYPLPKQQVQKKDPKEISKRAADDKPPASAARDKPRSAGGTSATKISLSGAQWENISAEQLDVWRRAYPALSLDIELAKAAAWIVANPANKKSNYAAYINRWLSRSQDRAPRQATEDRDVLKGVI